MRHLTIVAALGLALAACGGGGGGTGPDTTDPPPPVETPAQLAELRLSVGTLTPAFDPGVFTYTASVIASVESVTVTASPSQPSSKLALSSSSTSSSSTNADLDAGTASQELAIAEGDNTIEVRVTSDSGATATYTVTLSRNNLPTLQTLAGSSIDLDPIFASETTRYAGAVGFFQRSIVLSASTEAANAITVNGSALASGTDSAPIPLLEGLNELTVRVTDPDGASRDYVVSVTRTTIDGVAVATYMKASNAAVSPSQLFGRAIAVDGDTIAIGAPGEDGGSPGVNGDQLIPSSPSAGAVYVFVRDGETWTQQAYIKASNPETQDQFGWSVTLQGDVLVVGAPREDGALSGVDADQVNGAINAGAAYAFVRNGTTWTQEAYLKPMNTDSGDGFGYSVSYQAPWLAVSAYGEDGAATGLDGDDQDDSATSAGAVHLYRRSDSGQWTYQHYLKPSNTGVGDQFGFSLAMHENTLVVGANWEDSSATGVGGNELLDDHQRSGAAYVFENVGGVWSQSAYLKASNTDAGDEFGCSVAVHRDTIVIGAYCEDSVATGVDGNALDDAASDSGAAYVFERSGSSWEQTAYLKASNTGLKDAFGYSVAILDDAVLVGAAVPTEYGPFAEDGSATGINGVADDNASNSGAAYLFVREAGDWNHRAYLKASNTDFEHRFGTAVALHDDFFLVGAPEENGIASGIDGDQSLQHSSYIGATYLYR